MQTVFSRIGFQIACLVLALSFASLGNADISELDRFLPPDTQAYFAVKDISAAKEAAEVTAFYEVWESPGMQSLREEMAALWNDNVVSQIQIDPLTLLEAMQEDMVVGASLRAYQSPSDVLPIVVLAMHDPEERVKQILSAIQVFRMMSGNNEGPEIATFKYNEADVTTIPIEDGEVSVATMPGLTVACVGPPKLITELLDQAGSEEPAGFPASEAYASVAGFQKEDDLSVAWIDFNDIREVITAAVKTGRRDVDIDTVLSKIGVDNCHQYLMRYSVAHRGFFRQQIMDFDGPIHGLLRFLFEPGALEAGARFTPSSDMIMVTSLGSLSDAWEQWKQFMATVFGEKASSDMQTGIQAFETMLGFSLENDLLPAIGNELALEFEEDEFTFLVQTLEEESILAIVPKILLLWEISPEQIESESVQFQRIQAKNLGQELFYGASDGYLIISNSAEAYVSAAKGPEEGESILDSRRYGRALSYLPPPNHFVTITDLRGIANYTSTMLRLQQAVSGENAPAGLDLSFLADQTYPIVEVGVVQENRITRWAYSESGMENVLTAFSVAHSLISSFDKANMQARMGRANAEMRSIKNALETYYVDNNKYPDSLEDLTDPIVFLTEIPIDPWTGEPYYYEKRGNTYILVSAGPDRIMNFDPATVEGPFTEDKIPEEARTDNTGQKPGDIIMLGP